VSVRNPTFVEMLLVAAGGAFGVALVRSLRRGRGSSTRLTEEQATSLDAVEDRDLVNVHGIERTSPAFRKRLRELARRMGMDPLHLALVISFETAGTFDPSIRNPASSATGLIQFMSTTAKKLGTTTDALARMTALEQLDYVERYFLPWKGKLRTLEDVYMAVLWPSAVGKGADFVLFSEGSDAYEKNKNLDVRRAGSVTVRDATSRVRSGLKPELRAPQPSDLLASSAPQRSLDLRSVLLIGDSLAIGLAPSLKALLGRLGGTFTGRGIVNATMKQWLSGSLLDDALRAAKPTLVLVSLGTNDAKPVDVDRSEAATELASRIARSGADVVWILPPSLPFPASDTSLSIASAMRKGGFPSFASGALSIPRQSDQIHPTIDGYAKWADVIARWLGEQAKDSKDFRTA